MESLKDRFLRYVAFDTQSEGGVECFPSTQKQLVLLKVLEQELRDLGLEDVKCDEYGYVTGAIPATVGCEDAPVIAFLAHVDTSPDVSGADVKPRIIEDYDGSDIVLSATERIKVAENEELKALVGHTLITTDGTTLLGADDKAGVAEIMSVAAILMSDKSLKHGRIMVGFTPDEEVGRGVDFFDVEAFGADFAYTLDGGAEGEIEFENFNAAGAKISIKGHNHHPGAAKGRMRNALDIATELNAMLPEGERPQFTDGYEGFFHLVDLSGSVSEATMEYIIRDHSQERFEQRKELMKGVVAELNEKYGAEVVALDIVDQYYNMRRMVEPHMEIVELAEEAMRECGVVPKRMAIRGGTDGARLSFMGLPCPNLFAGGGNFHSRHEYASLTTMERAVDVVLKLVELWSMQRRK
ncbi:MAG: peptidase T [Rikenellaceae bacterium]